MYCFSSEYQNSLAKMFKIPDFDDDVPKTDLNYKKCSVMRNAKVTNNKVGNNHKPTVKKKKNEKTANNSIVKAKDKAKILKKQKNVQVKNNTTINSNIQETEKKEFEESKHKVIKIESAKSLLEMNKLVGSVNKKNKKKSKSMPGSGADWVEGDCFVTATTKDNKKKCKPKLEEFDEELLRAGKKKLSESIKREDQETQLLFTSNKPLTKKEKLRNMLMGQNSQRNPIKVNSRLRERMLEQLRSAQFRYLNEKLYTSSGQEAQELFKADPAAFHTYHAGYKQQLRKWPLNPLHLIAKRIKSLPPSYVVADMGCGEGALATLVPQTVHGFDLVATSPRVTACDMACTPLARGSVHAAVYCLALMGTRLTAYLLEANRILKVGGHLLIAEVESRFDSVEEFSRGVARLGFKPVRLDKSHQFFYFLEFLKTGDPPAKRSKLPQLTLKPCLYKRR